MKRVLSFAVGLLMAGSASAAGTNTAATLVYYDAVSNQTLDPREPQNNSSFAQGPIILRQDQAFRLDLSPTPGDATRVYLPHPEIFDPWPSPWINCPQLLLLRGVFNSSCNAC